MTNDERMTKSEPRGRSSAGFSVLRHWGFLRPSSFVLRHFLRIWSLVFLWSLEFGVWSLASSPTPVRADDQLTLRWTNNLLTLSSPHLPGGKLDVWYLEAFCRKGSTGRDWGKTVLP